MKKITATKLRAELYRVLDEVLATGESVEVVRESGSVILKPAVSEKRARGRRRKPSSNPNLVVGDPDDLVHFDWSSHWKPRL